jgi:hypothetical protein
MGVVPPCSQVQWTYLGALSEFFSQAINTNHNQRNKTVIWFKCITTSSKEWWQWSKQQKKQRQSIILFNPSKSPCYQEHPFPEKRGLTRLNETGLADSKCHFNFVILSFYLSRRDYILSPSNLQEIINIVYKGLLIAIVLFRQFFY